MTNDEIEELIIDSVRDPIEGSGLEFGWTGTMLYYRLVSKTEYTNWSEIKHLKFNPARMVRISKMLMRNGIDD